jgi:hypothetical protein
MMRVGVAGDWHANTPWALRSLDLFAEHGISQILHLGDFGLYPDRLTGGYMATVQRRLTEHGQRVYVTPGNHEDYSWFEATPFILGGEDKGWQAGIHERILIAPRGRRWQWEGRTFLSVGGASSIDRFIREAERIHWSSAEQISDEDVAAAVSGGFVNVMLSHDAPEGIDLYDGHESAEDDWELRALTYAKRSRLQRRRVADVTQPELLFHGHHHKYADLITRLTDLHGEGHSLHSIGLGTDEQAGNLGVLNLGTTTFEVLATAN